MDAGHIRRRARELGFQSAGIARAEVLEKEIALFDEWCDRGYDASMGWLRRRRAERLDIRQLLPDARSVIVVAQNYAPRETGQQIPGPFRVSCYARGTDYHEVLGARLEALLQWMQEEEPATRGKCYADTGPIHEKAWAVKAGIGWQGKHTNVITREAGSWVFLGVIVTNIDLAPDTPAVDRCGTCTRCIDACPTGAIVEPYILDSRKCISYLTIEHRGEIPGELAEGCGEWVFGCDICQEVCPWNIRFAEPSNDPVWEGGDGITGEPAEILLAISPEEFARRFAKSAIRRTRWDGLIRNMRNAMKNQSGKS